MKISIHQITKRYGKKNVLDQLSVDFEPGNCYCILGVNGSGKSTLFNLIMQFISPSGGTITYDGSKYGALPAALKRRMGYLSDPANLPEELTARQYLQFTGELYGVGHSHLEEMMAKIIPFLFDDHESMIAKRISVLSTGMKKKLALAGSILHSPEFLLLDEPFSTLDPVSGKKLCNFLKGYRNESRTIVFSSHNLEYLEAVDPLIIVLDGAAIRHSATLADFTKNYSQSISQSLMEQLKITDELIAPKWD